MRVEQTGAAATGGLVFGKVGGLHQFRHSGAVDAELARNHTLRPAVGMQLAYLFVACDAVRPPLSCEIGSMGDGGEGGTTIAP